MPGQPFTQVELQAMTPEEFADAQSHNFMRPVGPFQPEPYTAPVIEPRDDVWVSQTGTAGSFEFVAPSGQRCRLRPLTPEALLVAGLIDKVSRLEALADVLVAQSEGQRPAKAASLPPREDLELLLKTINEICVIAVVEPRLALRDKDGNLINVEGDLMTEVAIDVTLVDLNDRMAIMERSLRGVKALDRFRNA